MTTAQESQHIDKLIATFFTVKKGKLKGVASDMCIGSKFGVRKKELDSGI